MGVKDGAKSSSESLNLREIVTLFGFFVKRLFLLRLDLENPLLQIGDLKNELVANLLAEGQIFQTIKGGQDVECLGWEHGFQPVKTDVMGERAVTPFDPVADLSRGVASPQRVVVGIDLRHRIDSRRLIGVMTERGGGANAIAGPEWM